MEANKIGKELKKYREKAGITQEELAHKVGLNSKDMIYKYESGKRVPTIDKTLPKLCAALNIDFDIIFKEIKKPI